MQKQVYNILKPLVIPFDWVSLLRVRMVDFVGRHSFGFAGFSTFLEFDYGALVGELALLRPFAASHVLLTLINGWTTSSRIAAGKTLKCCLFGCNEERDHLAHYVSYPVLWGHVRALLGIHACFSPWAYFGLSLDSSMLSAVSFASFMFHAIRSSEVKPDSFLRQARAYNSLTASALQLHINNYSLYLDVHPLQCHKMGVRAPQFVINQPEPSNIDPVLDPDPGEHSCDYTDVHTAAASFAAAAPAAASD